MALLESTFSHLVSCPDYFSPSRKMSLIIQIIQLFEHPPFQKKMMYFKHSNTHSSIQTPTLCGAQTGVAEYLLAFDSLCGLQ